MWRIYQLIDPDTGEIRPFTPDLAPQVEELRRLMLLMVQAQARRDLAALQPVRQPLKPAPPPDEAEMLPLEFFEKALGSGGG